MTDFPAASNGASFGLLFNFFYGAGIPLDQADAVVKSVNRAASTWSSYIKDRVVLNAQIEFVNLPEAVIGGSRPAMTKVNYENFVTALFDDQTSAQDWTALNGLQLSEQDRTILRDYSTGELDLSKVKFETKAFSQFLNSQFGSSSGSGSGSDFLDGNGNDNNRKIWLTRANAKALGLVKDDDKKLDFVIQMSRSIKWDFDPSDGIAPGAYDFTSVMVHEIGHALGFVSGVDAFEFLTLTESKTLTDKNLTYVSPMDLFRYSPESASQSVIDMRIGGGLEKFFSLDGGRTKLADFSTGGLGAGGDGFQSSHWKASVQPLGIMQPSIQPGQTLSISSLDLTLLDVIGWNLDAETPLSRKATAIGLNWNRLDRDLEQRQQSVIATLANQWAVKNPGYSLESDLKQYANRLDAVLNREIEKKIDELSKKIGSTTDPSRRAKEIENTMGQIFELQNKQNEQLAKFAKDREKLDEQIRKWLDLDAKKLAEELRTAVGVEILKLAELINRATGSQRSIWETKLTSAFAYLTDNPGKAVEEVLKTTGPTNNTGWRTRYWGWVQMGDADLSLLYPNGSNSYR
jgi:hypothetical protein